MPSMHSVISHALACLAVSLSLGAAALAQFTPKSSPDRAKVNAAEVELIDKALGSGSTSSAPLGSAIGCTPGWVPTFGAQTGLDGVVWTAVQHDDGSGNALYIGGDFRSAGAVEARGIVRWDGERFSSVGALAWERVRALATFDDGTGTKLYAAGFASSPGGASVEVLECWDGTQWTSLGGVLDGPIHSLAVFDGGAGGELYVGGGFDTIGGRAAARLARWDGARWSGTGASFNGDVLALTLHDEGAGEQLYVGGSFSVSGLSPTGCVARFDGAQWWEVGIAALGGSVSVLESFDDGRGPTLWAFGDFPTPGGNLRRVLRYTSNTWSAVVSFGGAERIHDFHVYDDGSGPALYAAGSLPVVLAITVRHVMRWHALSEAWGPAGGGLSGAAIVLASFDSPQGRRLFVGGTFTWVNPYLDNAPAAHTALLGESLWYWPRSGLASPVLALGEFADAGGAALVAQRS